MGKGPASSGRAGASATAEYGRRRRAAVRRWVAARACLVAGAAAAVAAAWRGADGWMLAFVLAAAVSAWLLRPDPDPQRWQRGAAGEMRTAALLSRLPRRFVVLHDLRIPDSRANVDHLVVGPTGVWVVDTKAFRSALRARRGRILAGDHQLDTGPVAWEAQRVGSLLGVAVRPIVAMHGDGLRRRGVVVDGVRVIPAARLCRRLRRGGRMLTRGEIAELTQMATDRLPPA